MEDTPCWFIGDRGLVRSGIGRGSIVGRAPVEGVPQIRGCVKSTLNFTVTRRYRVPANRSIERSKKEKRGDPSTRYRWTAIPSRCSPQLYIFSIIFEPFPISIPFFTLSCTNNHNHFSNSLANLKINRR